MKLVIAIVQPSKVDDVRDELYKAGVNLITVSEVLGHGRQKGITEIYRGAKEMGNLLRKIRF
ncbi:MAG: P-II family nitrogen regulator, partial [Candidatus Omnitrophica bacterium]|nr:P-II family nitrogen regulator [Candidatus Omnitrophota bacterium]